MSAQQEYFEFMQKFQKHLNEIQDDFKKLSPSSQEKIAAEANKVLQAHGIMLTIDSLLNWFRQS